MKNSSVYTTTCLLLSCVVGAGFVGGNEIRKFFGGSVIAVIVFATLLLCALLFTCKFCKKYNLSSIVDLSQKVYKRASFVYLWVVSMCLFCTVIALYSTTANCLETLFGYKTNLPLYQMVTAVICFVLARLGKRCIEFASKLLLPVCLTFVVCAYIFRQHANGWATTTTVLLDGGITYGLYNLVAMLSVVARHKPKKVSIWATIVCIAILVCLQISTICGQNGALPALDALSNNKFLFSWGLLAIYLSGVSSILLCSLPVWDFLQEVICDKTTTIGASTCLAVALSNFGFDKIATICYPIIALVGLITLISVAIYQIKSRRKDRVIPCPFKKKNKRKIKK